MATSSTYYIDTADFSTATAVWIDTALTTKAPDGYYSFGGSYRQQFGGELLPIQSCSSSPSFYSYLDIPTFTGDGPGSITCVYFSDPEGDYVRNNFYASTDDLQIGDAVYTDTSLTNQLIPIVVVYFAYVQGTINKWIKINTLGFIEEIGSCDPAPTNCYSYEMVGISDGPGCEGYVNYSYTDCSGVLQTGASFSTFVTEYVCAQSTPTITCGSASITNLGACLL